MAANNKNIKLCEKFQSIMIDNFEDLSEGQVLIIIKMIEQLRKSEPNDTGAKKNVCDSSEGGAACAGAGAGAGAGAACAISESPTKDVSSESEATGEKSIVVPVFTT